MEISIARVYADKSVTYINKLSTRTYSLIICVKPPGAPSNSYLKVLPAENEIRVISDTNLAINPWPPSGIEVNIIGVGVGILDIRELTMNGYNELYFKIP